MPVWDETKKRMEKNAKETHQEKHTHVGKNNRLGEILELMSSNQNWTTIKLVAEKFGWTDQEAANKMSYYVKTGYIQVSDHIKASSVGRPLSIYTMTDRGSQVLGNYLARAGNF